MHIPNLVKIHCLLKLSSGNEKRMDGQMDGRTTDWRTDRHTDLKHETIIPRYYHVVGFKKAGHSSDLSLYSDIILVLCQCIIKEDYKNKFLVTGDWSQSTPSTQSQIWSHGKHMNFDVKSENLQEKGKSIHILFVKFHCLCWML